MKLPVCLSHVLVVLIAPFSFAQADDPTHEVSLGYSFLRSELETNRNGWVASFGERVNSQFWLKIEAGGNYRKTQFVRGKHPDFVHSILAGPEFKLREDSRLIPWAHVLVGATMNNHPTLGGLGTGGPTPIFRKTDVRFGFQPGGGIDYHLISGLGIRAGADYRLDLSRNTNNEYFRLHSGLVVRF